MISQGQPTFNHDAHVRTYYNEPAKKGSKFTGERLAVYAAYNMSLNGFWHDQFGSVEEQGYYCRVCFDDCPFIVCFREDTQGFVTEVEPRDYEAIWAQWIEDTEKEEDNEDNDNVDE